MFAPVLRPNLIALQKSQINRKNRVYTEYPLNNHLDRSGEIYIER